MRVLLIWVQNDRAILSDALSCCEPLPLEYLAGSLRANHDVVIYDQRLDPPLSSLADKESVFDLVGISIPFTTAVWAARNTAREARKLWPEAKIVVGGHHPTVSADWLDGFPVDFVITGEGGDTLKMLVEAFERGEASPEIQGAIPYKKFSPSSLKKHSVPASLDHLAKPDRSLLKHNREKYFHSIYRPTALIRFSSGCPFKCSFCILWRLTDQRYLTKTIPHILSELEDIYVNNVYVVDDEAFIQPQRMSLLADAIIESKINKKFHMYLRTDTALRHPEVLERWAEAGLHSVMVGAESTSDEELRGYNKGTSAEQTARAIELFHRLNIKVRANFIVRPEYSEDDFAKLAQTVADLRVDLPSFAVLTPLPGTQLYEESRHLLLSDNPDLFDCYHTLFPTKLPLDKFYSCFSDLLSMTALINGNTDKNTAEKNPGMFYFSNEDAFSKMVNAIRDSSDLHQISWSRSYNTVN